MKIIALLVSLIVVTLGLIFSATESWAQGKQKVVRSGKTVYDFQEADIMGQTKKPDVPDVVAAPDARFRRLLDLDEDFVPNIVRSVDEF